MQAVVCGMSRGGGIMREVIKLQTPYNYKYKVHV